MAALWWSPFLSHSNTYTLTFKVLPKSLSFNSLESFGVRLCGSCH